MTRRRWEWGLLVGWLALVAGINWAVPLQHAPLIFSSAAREHVSPWMVAAVIRTESGFRPDVVSQRGAVGLMQVLPGTAGWIRGRTGIRGALTNPATNIALGTWYLSYLLRRYHDQATLALAAYNGGPHVVDDWLKAGVLTAKSPPAAIPYSETREFVTRVLWLQRAYGAVYAGLAHRPR
ncbi:MAG: lytic transglycosylase domain-containing protein [Thermaerobacter sp.]|nr:lytic transglycosylase domain-containing protein [Thermaerobacter sp.]